MTLKLTIILVHGIGNKDPEWAEGLKQKIRSWVFTEIRDLLWSLGKEEHLPTAKDAVNIQSVYWKSALVRPESELKDKIIDWHENGIKKGILGTLIWMAAGWWFRRLQAKITSEYVGDIVGYTQEGAEDKVHKIIDQDIEELKASLENKDTKQPLTFVAHSLGAVIASNFIYDRIKQRNRAGQSGFDEVFKIQNIFTIGSPLAIFSMKFGGAKAFKNPIRVEDDNGRWLNILDRDDIIAMPIKKQNAEYQKVISADYRVNSGWFFGAHTKYFENSPTLEAIAAKLAIDWMVLNNIGTKEEQAHFYREYDKDTGLKRRETHQTKPTS